MSTTADLGHLPDWGYKRYCRHCTELGDDCGRAHYMVLAHEWMKAEGKRADRKEKLASEKQRGYITKLIAKKDLSERKRANRTAKLAGELTAREASDMIDELTALPWAPRAAAVRPEVVQRAAQAPEGMHSYNGVVYKVQRSQSGRHYAKRLYLSTVTEPAEWVFEYAPGAVRDLSTDTLMSREDAARFGKLYGVCCVCGRTLTNESSIAAGIGPICANTF